MKQRGCLYTHPIHIVSGTEYCGEATVDGCNYCIKHLQKAIDELRVEVDRDQRWLNQKKERLMDLFTAQLNSEHAQAKAKPHGKSQGKNLTRR
jgi:hypothetical protein